MSRFFSFLPFLLPLTLFSQKIDHDWENYIVPLNGKPVSINVDLGLKPLAPVLEDSMVIIVRLRLNQVDQLGMPREEDLENLLNMEDRLVEFLSRQNGAIFAGRFTQRGIREFYFYASDTTGYRKALNEALLPYTAYQWLAQAKKDKGWSHYADVLYPGAIDMLRIQSKRKLSLLELPTKGNLSVIHFLSFADEANMKKFLTSADAAGFSVLFLPDKPDKQTGRFEVQLLREEKISSGWTERVVVPLYKKLAEYGGVYKGWEGNMP